MPYVPIGKQSTDGSRTPTLREFIKSGRDLPTVCGVEIIFKPNKTSAYGLVCYPGFRVSIPEGTDLFDTVTDSLEEWISGSTFLCVSPNLKKPGAFELVIDSNESAEWDEQSWGYKLVGATKKAQKTRTRKKPTDVSAD